MSGEHLSGFEDDPQRPNGSGTATGAGQLPAPRPPGPGTELLVTDFGDDAGAGSEGMRVEEQLTPFLRMVQSNNPELKEGNAEYIADARQGMILDTAAGEVFSGKEGVEMVVCWREYGYGVWKPRDLGGGFRGMVPPDHPLVRRTMDRMAAKYGAKSARFKFPRYRDGRWSDEPALYVPSEGAEAEEVELTETGQLYCLWAPAPLTSGVARRAIVSFTVTSKPEYDRFNTRWTGWMFPQPERGADGRPTGRTTDKPAPIWSYRWRLTTRLDKNSRGQEYYVWHLDLAPPARGPREALYRREDPDLYDMARAFYQLCRAGEVKVDYASNDMSTADGAMAGATGGRREEQIPF